MYSSLPLTVRLCFHPSLGHSCRGMDSGGAAGKLKHSEKLEMGDGPGRRHSSVCPVCRRGAVAAGGPFAFEHNPSPRLGRWMGSRPARAGLRIQTVLCWGLRLPVVGGDNSVQGQTCPCGPLAPSAQLGQQESRPPGNGWEASPGSGPTSPKARMWRGTQAGEGSHRPAPALAPKCSGRRQRLSAGGGGRDSSCPGQDPV